ncbi:hypothetical protein C1H46_000551 [Malus baccata]|uniref:Pentacotripeptide-repeat region of PRORP domain-containing protein n=1 Tax=Malus baccata TaxID=106549 RepID=A0A540NTM9_MALBA|nr:hypothetical protein C1H46_000551 [Malus baccata]
MDPPTSLTKALFNNAHNPKLAWHLFKRILSSPSSDLRLRSLPVIARILIDSKMHREIDSLHQPLLHSQPLETLRPCLPSLMLILAKLNLPNKAVAHFKSLRSLFPDEPPSVYLYNLLLESSLTENYVDFVLWLYKDMILSGVKPETLLDDAIEVFDKMRGKGCLPNEYSVGILVRGKGKVFEANNILHEMMTNNCFPNTHTCNTLLHSLWKEGRTSEAEERLKKMNERGYGLDTVTCNIVIDGLCNDGKLDKAIEIVSGMWTHGSVALGNIRNSFIGLVDNSNNGKKCIPDLITYSTIIGGLCKAGRLDEAKKKFMEMLGKNLHPDSVIYDMFIQSFCEQGKISSAFCLLKDVEKNGCNKSIRTYNSLILGLGRKKQIFEIYGLMDEMRERGFPPYVCTYNNMMKSLCEGERVRDATSLLDEILQTGISLNISTFRILMEAFAKG